MARSSLEDIVSEINVLFFIFGKLVALFVRPSPVSNVSDEMISNC